MSDWEAEGYLEICGESILSLLRTWQPRSLATETIGTRSSLSDRAQELSEQVFMVEMGERARLISPISHRGQPNLCEGETNSVENPHIPTCSTHGPITFTGFLFTE